MRFRGRPAAAAGWGGVRSFGSAERFPTCKSSCKTVSAPTVVEEWRRGRKVCRGEVEAAVERTWQLSCGVPTLFTFASRPRHQMKLGGSRQPHGLTYSSK